LDFNRKSNRKSSLNELTIFCKWKILNGIPYFFSGIIASIIMLFIWLALVKHFFDTGWLIVLATAIIAIIIWIVIAVFIGLIVGITIIGGGC
jgi:hypothetical protein